MPLDAMSVETLRWVSSLWEKDLGWDSVPTVEQQYVPVKPGALECPWPGCEFRRYDPTVMWRHVHFSRKHDPKGDHRAVFAEYVEKLADRGVLLHKEEHP